MSDTEASDHVHKVNLTLINISKEVRDDSEATKIVRLVKDEVLVAPCQASAFLKGENTSREEVGPIQKQVFRFVRVKDKYTALGSMLLKSQAFHLTHTSSASEDRPVVALPRTQYKKPYIPLLDHDLRSSVRVEDFFPLSISHQFPFVGSAMLDTSNGCSPELRPKVGFDIVVFEGYNRKLYSSEEEFLNVFRDYFTQREWSLINSEKNFRLEEFYCRWAMKEAYTKALGVGMGVEFNSFDMCLLALDDGRDSGLWHSVSSSSDGSYISGSVSFLREPKSPEMWDFFFLPLDGKDIDVNYSGCACICIGPFPSPLAPSRFRTEVEWTDLPSLVKWHLPQATFL
jgi:4'-phosphopantetheinyl transferase